MSSRKSWMGGLATLALAVSGLFGTAVQADESSDGNIPEPTAVSIETDSNGEISPLAASCALGWGCIWKNNNYGGTWDARQYNGVVSMTTSNSAWANGNSCHRTSFRTGPFDNNPYFILDSQTRIGTNYRDPNLANGAGTGPYNGQNWKDRIRYIRFFQGANCVSQINGLKPMNCGLRRVLAEPTIPFLKEQL